MRAWLNGCGGRVAAVVGLTVVVGWMAGPAWADSIPPYPLEGNSVSYTTTLCGSAASSDKGSALSLDCSPQASAYAVVAGTGLITTAGSSGAGNQAKASADIEDAGVIEGANEVQIELLDELTNVASLGTGSVGAEFDLYAQWGPYFASSNTMEVTNAASYRWYWYPSDECRAQSGYTAGGTQYDNDSCLAFNTNQDVNVPILVPGGYGFAVSLTAKANSVGDGQISVSDDPLTIVLPEGATWGGTLVPVTYNAPSPVPEPPSFALFAAGLALLLAGAGWRRARAA